MSADRADVASGVAEVFDRILHVDVRGADAGIRLGAHPAWDSVAHIDLVLAIESAFGISFASYQIAELASVEQVRHAVEQKLAAGAG